MKEIGLGGAWIIQRLPHSCSKTTDNKSFSWSGSTIIEVVWCGESSIICSTVFHFKPQSNGSAIAITGNRSCDTGFRQVTEIHILKFWLICFHPIAYLYNKFRVQICFMKMRLFYIKMLLLTIEAGIFMQKKTNTFPGTISDPRPSVSPIEL